MPRKILEKIVFILTVTLMHISWIDGAEHPTSDILINKILNHKNVKQTAIFLSDIDIAHQNAFIQKITNRAPALLIDITTITKSDDTRFFELPILKYPRSSASFIFLQNHDSDTLHLDRIHGMLDKFIMIAPNAVRPKCLLILFSRNAMVDDGYLRNLLVKYWLLRFIDFTIIKLSYNDSVMFYYNPFMDTYHEERFESTSEIFPDKLTDLNYYPIKIAAFNYDPYIILHNNGLRVDISGTQSGYIKTMSEKLKFTLDIVDFSKPSIFDAFEDALKLLETNQAQIIALQSYAGIYLHGHNATIGRTADIGKYVLVTPILWVSKVNVSINTFIGLLLYPILIYSFFAVAIVLKLPLGSWRGIYIFQILMSSPLVRQPKDTYQKIVYLSLILISMTYSNDSFSRLLGIKITHEEEPFDTLEEVRRSGLLIFVPKLAYNEFFKNSDDLAVRSLMPQLRVMDPSKCLNDTLQYHRRQICVAALTYARYFITNSENRYKVKSMKIMGLMLYEGIAAFPYARGSVFTDIFDRTIQGIIESGIPLLWDTYEGGYDVEKPREDEENVLFIEIVLILLVGYSISAVTFLLEISRMRFRFAGCRIFKV